MNQVFEALLRNGTGLARRLLLLSLACLPVLLLISWSAVWISKAAAWMPPHPSPALRADPAVQRLRSAARAGDIASERLLVGWNTVPFHRWAQAQTFHALVRRLEDASAAAAA